MCDGFCSGRSESGLVALARMDARKGSYLVACQGVLSPHLDG